MRKRFEQQLVLGATPISEVEFSKRCLRSRDELPPVLMSLQYIFKTPELNSKIFDLLEAKVCKGTKKTGRPGMTLWQVFVLAVVRHTLGTNWDRLEHIANNDKMVRKIMGVPVGGLMGDEIEFSYQTLIDNVNLIDEDFLQQVNELVVKHGQSILKKKEDEGLELKTDSYVLETNVHFPTDLNLSWDAARKCLDMVSHLNKNSSEIKGWRKIKSIRSKVKSKNRSTSQVVFKGRKPEKKKEAVMEYLDLLRGLNKRFVTVLKEYTARSAGQCVSLIQLGIYREYLETFIDQIDRRLLQGETIPTSEKVYSIFEPDTEWINKGKRNPNVELGHRVLITTDQYQFIADYKVMENETDYAQVEGVTNRIETTFPEETIGSHSFDKGFFSKENYGILINSDVEQVILPKKGKKNKEEKQRESTQEFIRLRHRHSAVESNINMLEHHGLNRCRDKGLPKYKRYVGLSVLAYNLHILGNHLLKQEKETKRKVEQYKLRRAA